MPVLFLLLVVLADFFDWLRKIPLLDKAPEWMRRLIVLLGFIGAIAVLTGIVVSTAENVMATAPAYQSNLIRLLNQSTAWLGMDRSPDWQSIRAATIDKLDLQMLLGMVLGSVGSLAGIAMLVVIYAVFLLSEHGGFVRKLSVALPGESAEQTRRLITDINRRIGDYLAVKTLVNVILAAISFVTLSFCGYVMWLTRCSGR